MKLRSLRTLVEIGHVGSFAIAAERLGLTLSAVSAQMKTLEQDLQLNLFDRNHRPPSLTPAARKVVLHARTILAETDAIGTISDVEGSLNGVYRFGFVATASLRLLPGFLAEANKRHPDARFVVESGLSTDLHHKLRSGALDAAIITETPDLHDELLFSTLRTERFVLASPNRGGALDLAACTSTMPFVEFMPSTGIGLLVAEYLRRNGIKVRSTIVLDSVEAVMGCVNAGVGFAILPEPDAGRYALHAKLTPLDNPAFERRLSLAVAPESAIAKQIATLIELFERG